MFDKIESYLKAFLDLTTRGVVALEAIAVNTKPQAFTGTLAADTSTLESRAAALEERNQAARDSTAKTAAADKAKASAAAGAAKTAANAEVAELARMQKEAEANKTVVDLEEVVPADKVKAPTVDEARAALKGYAAIEGNDAAMKLLTQFGATSVSSLEEDKRTDFIQACK